MGVIRRDMEKICNNCSRKFSATHKTRKYCSQQCYWQILSNKLPQQKSEDSFMNSFFLMMLFLLFLVIILVGNEVIKSVVSF